MFSIQKAPQSPSPQRVNLHERLAIAAQGSGAAKAAGPAKKFDILTPEVGAISAVLPMELILKIIDTCDDRSTLARTEALSKPLQAYAMGPAQQTRWINAANKEFGRRKVARFALKFKSVKAKELCKLLVLDKKWQALCEAQFGPDETFLCATEFQNSTFDRIFKFMAVHADHQAALSASAQICKTLAPYDAAIGRGGLFGMGALLCSLPRYAVLAPVLLPRFYAASDQVQSAAAKQHKLYCELLLEQA